MAQEISKGSDLITFIRVNGLEDATVVVGAQGYTNANDSDNLTVAEVKGDKKDILLISDCCMYDIGGDEDAGDI